MEINTDYLFDGEYGKAFTNKNYSDSSIESNHRALSRIEKIIVHCTATDSEKWDDPLTCIKFDITPNGGNPALPRSGCPFCTYHFYVNKKGESFQLVSMNYQTMNCKGQNRDSVAVCINHGAVSDNVTQEQYDALVDTICHIFDFLDWNYSEESVRDSLFFHRDFNPGKTCPGKLDKEGLIQDVIKQLASRGDTE
jgi:hypothetical protein